MLIHDEHRPWRWKHAYLEQYFNSPGEGAPPEVVQVLFAFTNTAVCTLTESAHNRS
eukprot:SAG11_NODE_9598_length_897_cov_0.959900_2_plen_56_part_00